MNVNVDLIGKNGGEGILANRFLADGSLNLGRMRPFLGKDGNTYITAYKGGNPKEATSYSTIQLNSTATLRRDEWKQLDAALLEVSRYRLGGVHDLIDAGFDQLAEHFRRQAAIDRI